MYRRGKTYNELGNIACSRRHKRANHHCRKYELLYGTQNTHANLPVQQELEQRPQRPAPLEEQPARSVISGPEKNEQQSMKTGDGHVQEER